MVKYNSIVKKILSYEKIMAGLSDEDLANKTSEFRERLRNGGESKDKILPEAFAVVREAAGRTLGMKHFNVQLIGGIVLHEGKIAEMKTGEGKTLVATCPAYLNALDGSSVHIITVNDYLSKVNKEQMSKVFNFLGLSVACITSDTPLFDRKRLYQSDIVYGTNKEFGFDYLRDNMVRSNGQETQRGFNFAIIDEADSILIDEARTPLIIAGQTDQKNDVYIQADTLVKHFEMGIDNDSSFVENHPEDVDFLVNMAKKSIQLTDRGVASTERFFKIDCLGDIDNTNISHCVMQAIRANFLMDEGKDYIVKDDEVVIVDNFTGRLMDGRRFNDGLHQAIEAKEHVTIHEETKTFAMVTLQNYFRMYTKLSGMTGTAATEKDEFKKTYGMDVVVIPTNKKVQRIDLPDLIFKTEEEKLLAVCEKAKEQSELGRPVLIGTNSIVQSEKLSKLFKSKHIKHQVLNAKQYEKEAEIIAQAGKSGAITIATNMAGRGTDILLGGNPEFLAIKYLINKGNKREQVMYASSILPTSDPSILRLREEYKRLYDMYKCETTVDHLKVVNSGGLYVIGTERAEAVRVDNQLRGRAGRQGDPGMSQFYISLDDNLVHLFSSLDEKNLTKKTSRKKVSDAQHRVESQHFEIRKNVLEYDDVANVQRNIFYKARKKVLEMENFKPLIDAICPLVSERIVLNGLNDKSKVTVDTIDYINEYLANMVGNKNRTITYCQSIDLLTENLSAIIADECDNKYTVLGAKANDLVKQVVISYMDKHWMEHLDNMEALQRMTSLTGYGNIKPIDKFKIDAYELFKSMFRNMEEDILNAFFHIKYRFSPKKVPDSIQNSTIRINSKEQEDLAALADKLAMECLRTGKMISPEKIKKEACGLARDHILERNHTK